MLLVKTFDALLSCTFISHKIPSCFQICYTVFEQFFSLKKGLTFCYLLNDLTITITITITTITITITVVTPLSHCSCNLVTSVGLLDSPLYGAGTLVYTVHCAVHCAVHCDVHCTHYGVQVSDSIARGKAEKQKYSQEGRIV